MFTPCGGPWKEGTVARATRFDDLLAHKDPRTGKDQGVKPTWSACASAVGLVLRVL